MTPNEFMLFYVILPWALAGVGIISSVAIFVLGGKELRTIMASRMDARAQFVFSWVDGGYATLEKYHPFEHGVLEGDKTFLLYATPLTAKDYTYTPITVEQVKASDLMVGAPDEEIMKVVNAENERRKKAADEMAEGIPEVNAAAKANCTFAGKPCWIGYQSAGVAMSPTMLKLVEEKKRKPRKRTEAKLEVVHVDAIKEFLTMNFSPRRLFQIWRSGEDAGLHGRAKKPFPTLLVILLLGAAVALIIGFLILSGKIDLGGAAKGILGQ